MNEKQVWIQKKYIYIGSTPNNSTFAHYPSTRGFMPFVDGSIVMDPSTNICFSVILYILRQHFSSLAQKCWHGKALANHVLNLLSAKPNFLPALYCHANLAILNSPPPSLSARCMTARKWGKTSSAAAGCSRQRRSRQTAWKRAINWETVSHFVLFCRRRQHDIAFIDDLWCTRMSIRLQILQVV